MISSQIANQLFSKELIWNILIDQYPTKIWYRTAPKDLKIECWSNCIYIHLPKNLTSRGFSLFISFHRILRKFMDKVVGKAMKLTVIQVRTNIFTASSSQGSEAEPHTVNAHRYGISCSCMLFKCLTNRMRELPKIFKKAIKNDPDLCGQGNCHHIQAVIEKLGYYDISEYIKSRRTNYLQPDNT